MFKSAISLALILTTSLGVAQKKEPQQPNRATAARQKASSDQTEADRRTLITQEIIETLRQTASESRNWERKDLAAKAQAEIADLLWDHDIETSRAILISAWQTAKQIEEQKRDRSRYRNRSPLLEVKSGALLVARKRDRRLAEKWLSEIEDERKSNAEENDRGVFDDRTPKSSVLLQTALAVAKENPQLAAEIARESLRDGISFGLQEVLVALQERSVDLAESVFRAALARLATNGLIDPNELLILYSYLYRPGVISAAGNNQSRSVVTLAVSKAPARVTAIAQLKPQLAAQFLDLAADLLLNAPMPSSAPNASLEARAEINALDLLIPRVREVAPEKAALLAQRAQAIVADAQFASGLPAPPEGYIEPRPHESRSEYAQRRVEYLESLAEREAPGLRRDLAFAKAALATEVENYERGQQIAARIDDDELRSAISNWLAYRATLHLLKRKRFDKARQLIENNSDLAQRAVCLIAGAQRMIEAQDLSRARDWLREASNLITRAPLDGRWTKIALGIAAAYGKFDKLAALSALQEAVKLMNKFSEASVDGEEMPSLARFSGVPGTESDIAATGFGLASAISSFEIEDFDVVRSILREIKNSEARGSALLRLSRHLLKARASEKAENQDRK